MTARRLQTGNPKQVEPAHLCGASALFMLFVMSAAAAAADQGQRQTYPTDGVTERIPLVTAFPKYPYVARRDRIEGEAVVCFTISKAGKVIRPTVRHSTHRIFRRPALKAIKNSAFEPLAEGQTRSPVKTCRTFRFRLDPVLAENNSH